VARIGHRVLKTKSQTQGVLEMQFMILFSRHPDKAETPAPADLREAEFEKMRSFYIDGLLQQAWLPLIRAGFLQPPMIVPLKPYSGFAPRS
jgi:hypothetical protein